MDFSVLNHQAPSLHSSQMLVRFQDCDPFGHLNNGRYLDYFLDARDNQVTYDYRLPLSEFVRDEQKGWVVQKHEVAYLRPALYGEEVLVQTATAYFDDYYALVEGRMLDKDGTHLKAILWMHLAFVSLKTGRRIVHTEDVKNFFSSVCLNEFTPKEISFDERTKQLNDLYRKVAK